MILDRQPVVAARGSTGDGRRAASCAARLGEGRTAAAGGAAPATGRRSADTKRPAVAEGQNLPDDWSPATGTNVLWRTADSRARALQPDRLGRRGLRDERDQQPARRDVQARSLRRRRCVGRSLGASLDAVRDRQAHRTDPLGANGGARRAAQQAAHQVHLRQQLAGHRRPHRRRLVRVAGHLRLRLQRRLALVRRSWPCGHGRLRHPVVRVGAGQLADHLERPGDRAVRHADRLVPAGAERRDRRDGVEDGSAGVAVVGHADDRRRRPPGPELVTNASNFMRGYDPKTGPGVVAARWQLEDHRADADLRRLVCTSWRADARRSGRCSPCGPARAAT